MCMWTHCGIAAHNTATLTNGFGKRCCERHRVSVDVGDRRHAPDSHCRASASRGPGGCASKCLELTPEAFELCTLRVATKTDGIRRRQLNVLHSRRR